jgi:DNA (cytosine-5)-methyltransferase 1
MKVLNLYAGIGGNRKLWTDVEVTAVELNPKIAEIYSHFFPDDKMIIGDAHHFLLDHYKEFDFIWASPPCPTHSDIRRCSVHKGQVKAVYPDMTLYQEIILLQHFAKGLYCIENVRPYYKPLIPANHELQRHLFWTNFYISKIFVEKSDISKGTIETHQKRLGISLDSFSGVEKRKVLRNCVTPEIGLHILEAAKEATNYKPTNLFEVSND